MKKLDATIEGGCRKSSTEGNLNDLKSTKKDAGESGGNYKEKGAVLQKSEE